MKEQKDEIRLKELLNIFNKEEYKELIEILDRDQKRYHTEQLRLGVVSQQRELLKAFLSELEEVKSDEATITDEDAFISQFLKAFNCG